MVPPSRRGDERVQEFLDVGGEGPPAARGDVGNHKG